MGFLDFFRSQQDADSQMALFDSDELTVIDRTEPTRNLVHNRLKDEIKQRRPDGRKTYRFVNATAIQEMLGTDPDTLYDALGIPRNQRQNLPQEAKEALMVGDIAAFEQILDDNAIGHDALVKSARKGYRKARGVFRWNR